MMSLMGLSLEMATRRTDLLRRALDCAEVMRERMVARAGRSCAALWAVGLRAMGSTVVSGESAMVYPTEINDGVR